MSQNFTIQSRINDQAAVLFLRGRFDFSQYTYFKSVQGEVLDNDAVARIVLDLEGLEYLDSAALGILLVMLDRAKQHGKALSIRNAKGVVREILDVAHFERMFEFED